MLKVLIYFLLACWLVACASQKQADQQICPKIVIHTEDEIKLTEDETRLICGDLQTEAYKTIPTYQSGFFLTGFLQSRGHSNPRYETREGVLHVYPQEKTYVKDIVLSLAENEQVGDLKSKVEKLLLKHFGREELRPKTLDDIEADALKLFRNESYACAEVESVADAITGTVRLKVSGLTPFKFGRIEREEVEGLYEEAFERFTSFSAEDKFLESELVLTEKRLLRDEIVQATFFQERCDLAKGEFSLKQRFITGPPRTIRFGIGASTEVGGMARIKWANMRYGNMASRLEAKLQASFKSQSLSLFYDGFFWKNSPRRSLVSELTIVRENQKHFEELTAELRPHLQWTRDNWSRFWQWSAGPSLITSRYKTNIDLERQDFTTLALEGELLSKTHSYESYDIHPEDGELYQLNLDARHPALGFKDPLLKMDWTIVKLMRLWSIGKGVAILGGRLNADTTWVNNSVDLSRLPPSVKQYAGGSDDVRGYELNSIPGNDGLGALTKLGAKLELRKTHTFISTLESFAFIDAALMGQRSWMLDDRLYYSPGLGLRWLSPIGLFQAYVARTLSTKSIRDDGLFFFIGLGGMF